MKYPGGYQIIDLGDLSKITNQRETTIKIPGIFEQIRDSVKPVILTGRGTTEGSSGLSAIDLAKCHWFVIDGNNAFGYRVYDDTGVLTAYYAIAISPDDYVLDMAYES